MTDEIEYEECFYCKVEYPKPVELHHTEEECKIDKMKKMTCSHCGGVGHEIYAHF